MDDAGEGNNEVVDAGVVVQVVGRERQEVRRDEKGRLRGVALRLCLLVCCSSITPQSRLRCGGMDGHTEIAASSAPTGFCTGAF